MPQANSGPGGRLARTAPCRALGAAPGGGARALTGAFGVEAPGPDGPDPTPARVERSRASRGLPPPAGQAPRNLKTSRPQGVRMSPGRASGGRREHASRTHPDTPPQVLHLGKRPDLGPAAALDPFG